MSQIKKSLLLIAVILLIDQIFKVWIKTHFRLGEEINVMGEWFIIHFTENEGMAFGWKLNFLGEYAKLILSIFRIIAIGAIGWYLFDIARKKAPFGVQVSVALIIAGAIGNMIDSAFYGLIFSDSYGRLAEFMPEEGGYERFLHGRVVDMLHFPIIETTYPSWSPWAGESLKFFAPVFNIADASITTGVFSILLFHRKYFSATEVQTENEILDTTPMVDSNVVSEQSPTQESDAK